MCHDKSFLFLGRIDDQVKLRGQRLEIGEINSTIRQSVAIITDVATFVLRHPKQQKDQLVTFLVADTTSTSRDSIVLIDHSGGLSAVAKARDGCTERLPGYMVPTFFIPVSRMPLSTNNKTDAKTLKELFCQTSLEELQQLAAADKSSFDDKEKRLAQVLSAFCKVPLDAISPSSNFFELGLDSISVLGFCTMLKKAGYSNINAARIMFSKYLQRTQGPY
jgi:aryl carrier-like protein